MTISQRGPITPQQEWEGPIPLSGEPGPPGAKGVAGHYAGFRWKYGGTITEPEEGEIPTKDFLLDAATEESTKLYINTTDTTETSAKKLFEFLQGTIGPVQKMLLTVSSEKGLTSSWQITTVEPIGSSTTEFTFTGFFAGGTDPATYTPAEEFFFDFSINGAKGNTGAEGAEGPEGPKGEKGATGETKGPAGGDLEGEYPNPLVKLLAVTTAKINALAVTAAKLGEEAVETAKIKALAVTEAKLAAEAVAEAKIKNLAVTAAKLGEEAVETAKIKASAVTEAKLNNEAVATNKIKALAVTEAKLAAEAVAEGKIKNLAVTAAKIAEETITGTKVASATITDNKLAKPVIAGSLSSAGAVVDGTGFSAEKTATGTYKITLTNELASNGILVALCYGGEYARSPAASKKVFEVITAVPSTGTATDTAFGFLIKAS